MQRFDIIALVMGCALAIYGCELHPVESGGEVTEEVAVGETAPTAPAEVSEGAPLQESGSDEGEEAPPAERREIVDRYPDLSPSERAARSTNAFGHALIGRLGEGNVAFSPLSISTAMAMTYAGAGGATADQLAEVMQFPSDAIAGFGELSRTITSSESEPEEEEEEGASYTLEVANDVWVQSGFAPHESYLAALRDHFGTAPRKADFRGAPDASRRTINADIARKTHGMIPDLLAAGAIKTSTRIVLTNALYLDASWEKPFEKERTGPGRFHGPDGEVEAPMMERTDDFRWESREAFNALEMPYAGGKLAALVVLPHKGEELDAVQSALDADTFASTVDGLESAYVRVRMPKFKVSDTSGLADVIREMGAPLPFNSGADFSGIAPSLYISDITHQAVIEVDEKGTEAAAATAVVVSTKSYRPKPRAIPFHVERPFLFYVYDKGSGAILFASRIVEPKP